MGHILEFDGIEKSFGGYPVLSSIHMKCQTGTVTGLLGRNGSGKSTLMKIVFGTMDTTFKSIRLDNQGVNGNYFKSKIIGYLPQHHFIPAQLSVKQALEYYEIPLASLADPFPDFHSFQHKKSSELSGGFLRVLETFLILKSKHLFVMLDEPFSGLMPLYIEVLKKIILEEKATKGIVLSDHLYI
jgi:ABC-type multidrug transport system ATPase subunit